MGISYSLGADKERPFFVSICIEHMSVHTCTFIDIVLVRINLREFLFSLPGKPGVSKKVYL